MGGRSSVKPVHRLLWVAGLSVTGWLAGCSSLVDVRTLATGRSDVAAYELRGSELGPLRREAQRLCPQGGEVLRQAGIEQHPERLDRDDGRLRRWASAAGDWVNPPRREAQMMLLCKDSPGAGTVQSADERAAAAAAVAAAAHPPIGPLNVDW